MARPLSPLARWARDPRLVALAVGLAGCTSTATSIETTDPAGGGDADEGGDGDAQGDGNDQGGRDGSGQGDGSGGDGSGGDGSGGDGSGGDGSGGDREGRLGLPQRGERAARSPDVLPRLRAHVVQSSPAPSTSSS